MKYDLLYIDQGFVEGKDNWENCLLLYDWILNIKRANPSFRVAIKPPSNAGTARRARLFPEQIGRSYEKLGIEILSGDAYEHALSAKVIAAHYSTMVYELKGSGLPVLICDPLGECKFFPDSERFNQFVVTNYDSFVDLISEILLNKGSLAELIGTKEFQYFGHNSYGAAEKMVEILLN